MNYCPRHGDILDSNGVLVDSRNTKTCTTCDAENAAVAAAAATPSEPEAPVLASTPKARK
jgi:hypothetical protein